MNGGFANVSFPGKLCVSLRQLVGVANAMDMLASQGTFVVLPWCVGWMQMGPAFSSTWAWVFLSEPGRRALFTKCFCFKVDCSGGDQ